MTTSEADRVEKGIPVTDDGPAPPQARGKSSCTNGSDNGSRCGNGSSNVKSRLSAVSKMYDIDGDGTLMRDMDKTGRGCLTNDKIHDLMTEHLHTQRELFKVKKIIIG